MALFHSLWTLALLAIFIGIVAWAWSKRRKERFEQAARMPLEDEGAPKRGENG